MTTINFAVGVPDGAPIGNVDGQDGYISTYLAENISGYTPQNNVIFCIEPDLDAIQSNSSYTLHAGIGGTGLSLLQTNALEGLFSHYIDGGNTSFAAQEATMIADWTIVNPQLAVSGVDSTIFQNATLLANDALAQTFTIDPNLKFTTFVSDNGAQSFVNVSAVPLPDGFGLFAAAMLLLAGFAARKKFLQA